jgi:excisionase family DNA binding protein
MEQLRVYTLAEIENLLRVTRRTVYRWIKAGKLKAFKAGREYRVTEEALRDFLDKGTE